MNPFAIGLDRLDLSVCSSAMRPVASLPDSPSGSVTRSFLPRSYAPIWIKAE